MTKCKHNTRISDGNKKMGPIPSFSLMPGVSCPKNVPCRDTCYVNKNMLRGPWGATIKASYMANQAKYDAGELDEIAEDIIAYIKKNNPVLFRWFVSGDIPSKAFLEEVMYRVANECPYTLFMTFTKNYAVLPLDGSMPKNLHVMMSTWKDYRPSEALKKIYPCEYFNDGTEACRVPEDAIKCNDDCINCQVCWKIHAGQSVVIDKH